MSNMYLGKSNLDSEYDLSGATDGFVNVSFLITEFTILTVLNCIGEFLRGYTVCAGAVCL